MMRALEKQILLAVLLMGLLVLSACDPRGTPQVPKEQLWNERHRQLANLNQWDMRGRIGRGGWFSFTASLSWKHQPKGHRIRILGPFGNPNVTIAVDGNNMILRTPEGVMRSTNPEVDFKKTLGWSLPMTALPYWVRGMPEPGAHKIVQMDEHGQIIEMRQKGWLIKFDDYEAQPLAGGLYLPTDVYAERITQGADDEEVTIAVSVRQWFKQARGGVSPAQPVNQNSPRGVTPAAESSPSKSSPSRSR